VGSAGCEGRRQQAIGYEKAPGDDLVTETQRAGALQRLGDAGKIRAANDQIVRIAIQPVEIIGDDADAISELVIHRLDTVGISLDEIDGPIDGLQQEYRAFAANIRGAANVEDTGVPLELDADEDTPEGVPGFADRPHR
jgi:hypothetical protein